MIVHSTAVIAAFVFGLGLSLQASCVRATEQVCDADCQPRGQCFFVAVEGKIQNEGTRESPWDLASTLAGRHSIPPGSTILLQAGTYRHPDRSWDSPGFTISLAGERGKPIHIRPASAGRVTIDGKLEVKHSARHLRVWELEITVSETIHWNRRVRAGGMEPDDSSALPSGGLNILGGSDSKFIHLVIRDMYSGVGLWRTAVDAELYGCVIYGIGAIGPDRYHGPGIYTQNQSGTKQITDNLLLSNYSTTLQAYGSQQAPVQGFHVEGNIAFAPIKAGGRERILIGGAQPSSRIVATENILYEVPLELGYSASHNEDAIVTGNRIVNAPMIIKNFRNLVQSGNIVVLPDQPRPDRVAEVILRPSRYIPGRANLAIFNWQKKPQVNVTLNSLLMPGQAFSIVSALDYFGEPLVQGRFDGRPIPVPIPVEPRTGDGEFCAFVVLPEMM